MLDIFILASTSLPPYPPISPSINEVRSVVVSNVDGVTPNHLLQQIYGTQILDEDVDLELSDEELESVAGNATSVVASEVNTHVSDVFINGNKIIDIDEFLRSDSNPNSQLNYICERLPYPINKDCCIDRQAHIQKCFNRDDRGKAEVIRQQLLAPAVKQKYPNGFNIVLETGQVIPR